MSSSLSPPQSVAVLHLVQRLVHLASTTATSADVPASLEAAVAQGTPLYTALRAILPTYFPPLPASASPGLSTSPASATAALVKGMSVVLQGAVEPLHGGTFVLTDALPQLNSVAASSPSPQEAVLLLAPLFTMTVVLSGSQTALQQLKLLSRDDQLALSNLAKTQLQTLSLKTRPRPPTVPVPAATVPSSSAAPQGPATAAALPPGTLDMVTDMSYYHNASVQLRKELTASQSQVAGLEARCEAAEQERDTWTRKYQFLLGNQGAGSTTANGGGGGADAAGAESTSASTVALLKQRCEEKDGTIETLKSKVEEQTTRMSAFKETLSMHEVALQALRRKLKLAEEGVMAKATECRRLQDALSVSEDKLSVQLKARTECENTIESLRSQVTVLQLTVQEHEAMEGHDPSHMAGNLSGSFASNGSIDRVVVLENEMDEVRAQRDALQKQLGVLQRQMATLPAPVSDAAAATDTLKAHVRLLEKEKEDLRQQLSSAMAQMEAAVGGQTAQGLSFSTPQRRTSRFSSSGVGGGGGGGGGGTRNGDEDGDDEGGASPNSAVRGGSFVESSVQRKLRTNTRRDQTILSALLLEYGYQNLLLQQHNVLLHRDAQDAAIAVAQRVDESQKALAGPGGVRARTATRAFTGSFLTRQRREIEEGLLESIIHNHS